MSIGPDPTARTMEALVREMAAVREVIEIRLTAMDKAVGLLQAFADRTPTTSAVEAKVDALKELTEVTFHGNQVALDAALKTQKEASDKIEANFTKQFENIQEIMRTQAKATDDKIDDLKTRVTSTEGRSKGIGDGWVYLVGGIGLILTILSVVAVVIQIGK